MPPPKIYTTNEWGAKAVSATFAQGDASGIIIHHTTNQNRAPQTGDAEKNLAFDRARQIQTYHMDHNHWADTGQHFLISRGGLILEGRHGSLAAAQNGKVVRGAHAGDNTYNQKWFGIENE